jgi:hypothetical protein
MPAETAPLVLYAGQIVLADWRGDAVPKEPNKRRPAGMAEDDGLFAPSDPNAILSTADRGCCLGRSRPVDRDRADSGERLQQALLGGVASGGHDLEGALAGHAILYHPTATSRHPPADRPRRRHRGITITG